MDDTPVPMFGGHEDDGDGPLDPERDLAGALAERCDDAEARELLGGDEEFALAHEPPEWSGSVRDDLTAVRRERTDVLSSRL